MDEPLPNGLPVVRVCKPCNRGFSQDEEYLRAFLSCVLAGSTAPELQKNPKVQRSLIRSPALGARIEAGRSEFTTVGGGRIILWKPEVDRVQQVVVKNARGHAFYEMGEPMLDDPVSVWMKPIELLTMAERSAFEDVARDGWAEVGSRMMTRQLTGVDSEDGWVIVQPDVYRYAVIQDGLMTVRSVIWNYLATEVHWN